MAIPIRDRQKADNSILKSKTMTKANAKINFPDSGEAMQSGHEGPENFSNPFIKKFQTAGNKYILDVNTNRVLRVDPVTWEIVDEY